MGDDARADQPARTTLSRPCSWGWLTAVLLLAVPPAGRAAEIVIYGFEGSLEGWKIPEWAKTSADYVGKDITVSPDEAQEGASSLRLEANFPGGRWTAAYAEREVEVTDWSQFGTIRVSLYLPGDAPPGLRARIILTVGEQWTWTEMNRALPLVPGQWTTLTANLKPGSMDWKFFPDERFRSSVRKLGLRIESDKQPAYNGSILLDNVRLEE